MTFKGKTAIAGLGVTAMGRVYGRDSADFAAEASKPFFDGAKRRELMIQRCKTCGAYQYPVKLCCDVCLSGDIEWVKASGKAKLYTFGVMHQLYHPGFADEIPYNVAIVELDEGVRCISNVVGCANADLRIGMSLEVTFVDVNEEVSVPKFKPAGGYPVTYEFILYEKKGRIAYITLNRPEVMNALNVWASHEMFDILSEDRSEGPKAFAEKRKPEWKGR